MKQTADLFAQFRELTDDAPSAAMLTLAHALLSNGQPEQPELLTVKQAAARLNVSRDSVYDLCRDGTLRSERIGRVIRIRKRDLESMRRPLPR